MQQNHVAYNSIILMCLHFWFWWRFYFKTQIEVILGTAHMYLQYMYELAHIEEGKLFQDRPLQMR